MFRSRLLNIIDWFSISISFGFFLLFSYILIVNFINGTDSITFNVNDYNEKNIEVVFVIVSLPVVTFSIVRRLVRLRREESDEDYLLLR